MLVMAASFLWSAAAVHIADMVRNKNFAINNAGPIFWWDILTPLRFSSRSCCARADRGVRMGVTSENLSPAPEPPLF
jgi:hypothetical protein